MTTTTQNCNTASQQEAPSLSSLPKKFMKPPLKLLPDSLSSQREIWTHGLVTPPSGSPLYSEGDLSWDTVIQRLNDKEKMRESHPEDLGSNLGQQGDAAQEAHEPTGISPCSTAPKPTFDLQNKWIEELLAGKTWRSYSNSGTLTASSRSNLSGDAASFEYVPPQLQKRYSAPAMGGIPHFADIATPPPQQGKWRDSSNGCSPMEDGMHLHQHQQAQFHQHRRRRSHSGSPLSGHLSESSSCSSSPPMRRKRRTVMCKFFLQGKCTKGDDCPFSHNATRGSSPSAHESSPSSRRNSRTRIPCKYVSNGRSCPFGENCLFNHRVDSQFSSNETKRCQPAC
mmetsp:Transcript_5497/g.20633  ORF Transcript_5497/g.20633 Transcript_5497/m.20633 type:complete len:339 (-) Transcript_5497:188-1204(-)